MTTTATKKPPKGNKPAKPPRASTSSTLATKTVPVEEVKRAPDVHAEIDIRKLAPSPTNPRKHFDAEALQTLANSIKNSGLIQPIIVRPLFAGNHEIIAGERRYRASKLAGLKTVPCMIRDLSDAEVIEVQLLENLEREDLNAIEEAESFLKLTTEGGYTQRSLADRLNRTQGHIANRIRLLDLPEAWRKKVISQEIPATHVRALVPYAMHPTLVAEVEKALQEQIEFDGFPNVDGFEDLVLNAVHEATASMKKATGIWKSSLEVQFKVTPEIETELVIIEVPPLYGDGAKQKRAVNVQRWQELQDEALAKAQKRSSAKLDKETSSSPKLSAAEIKKRKQQQAEQFNKRLSIWLTGFKQQRLVKMLAHETFNNVTQLLIFFALRQRIDGRENAIREEIKARGGSICTRKAYFHSTDMWASIRTVKSEDAPNMAACLVQKWIQCDFTRSYSDVVAADINAIYRDLGGNLESDWMHATPEKRREYLELHNREQLVTLAFEEPYAGYIRNSSKPAPSQLERLKRGDLIKFIHENCPSPDCPPALLKLK